MAVQATEIFVNLPVKNLNKSVDFFTNVGFEFNAQFTNDIATCLVISENIFVMLLVEDYFKTFTKKEIPDTKENAEVLVALSVESKEKVIEIVSNALSAGALPANEPMDQGFMYSWSFQDLDGHIWELAYMDKSEFN